MQPVAEDSASQGDDGDFLALGLAGALEQEGHLFLLGTFADQTQQPTSQMADHQEHLKACQDPPDHKPAQIGCYQVF
jgi:hypothetical protein